MHAVPSATARLSWTLLALALLWACQEDPGHAGRGISGPRSGGLVFIREVDGKADLARARISDGAVVVVSPTPGREERWPYWSDVTRRVVFPARPYGAALRMDLVLWDPETGEEEVVGSTPARDERWPTWSPVAARFAYAFRQPGHPSGIAVYDLETGRSEVIASVPSPGSFLRPAYSLDGSRLVAQRRPDKSAGSELWLLEDGRRPRRLTGEPGMNDTKPRFTPDGRTIFFSRWEQAGAQADLFRLDLESGRQERFASLPTANDHSSRHSPTRDEIAFISNRDGSRDLFLVDLSDGAPRNLTRSPEIDEGAPLWSPDGERLVILRMPRTESGSRPPASEYRVTVIDREGRALFETQGMMADWMPAWPGDANR